MKNLSRLMLICFTSASLVASAVGPADAAAKVEQRIRDLRKNINGFIGAIQSEFNATKNKYSNRVFDSTYPVSSESNTKLGDIGIERIVVGFADPGVTGTGTSSSASFNLNPTQSSSGSSSNTGFLKELVNYSVSQATLNCPDAPSDCTMLADCAHDFSNKFLIEIDFIADTSINPLPISGKKLLFVAKSSGSAVIDKTALDNSTSASTDMTNIDYFDCINVKSVSGTVNNGNRFGEQSAGATSVNLGQGVTDGSGTSQAGFAGCFAYPNFRNCGICSTTMKTCGS